MQQKTHAKLFDLNIFAELLHFCSKNFFCTALNMKNLATFDHHQIFEQKSDNCKYCNEFQVEFLAKLIKL